MDQQFLAIVCIFIAVGAVCFTVSRLLFGGGGDAKLRTRLNANAAAPAPTGHDDKSGFVPMIQRLGQAAAEPFMPKTREKQSGIRKSLGYAGIYSAQAVKVVTGCKVIFLGIGLIGGYIAGIAM